MYIPKSQISKKITNGGLLKVKSTQQVYIGNYIKTSKNKYYAGHSNTNVGLELELITNNPQFLNPNTISESTIPVSKFNILNKDIKSFLEKTNQIPTFKPTPSEEDYTNGFIRRYFSKRINENKYIEISKKVFDSIKSKKGKYDHNLYSVGSLIWNIRGNDVHKSNSLSILSTQRSFPNIFTLFPILNEFLRPSSNIRENLETKGNELYFSDGTEYIGFYHIHPVQGPMEGATHSSTPHSKLYYTNQLPKFPDRSYEEFVAQYTPPVVEQEPIEPGSTSPLQSRDPSPTIQRSPIIQSSSTTRDRIASTPIPSSTPSGGGGGGY